MAMYPYIVIVCTDRWSEILSTKPDKPNALTCQSSNTNNVHRDPIHGPVTPYSFFRGT